MKTAMLGALLGAVLAAVVLGGLPDRNPAFAQRPGPQWSDRAEGGLIAFAETVDQKYQQVTVIDPKTRAMSVYHVELASGKIALRSVRNFHWDLQLLDWNSASPLPREIQTLLEQR